MVSKQTNKHQQTVYVPKVCPVFSNKLVLNSTTLTQRISGSKGGGWWSCNRSENLEWTGIHWSEICPAKSILTFWNFNTSSEGQKGLDRALSRNTTKLSRRVSLCQGVRGCNEVPPQGDSWSSFVYKRLTCCWGILKQQPRNINGSIFAPKWFRWSHSIPVSSSPFQIFTVVATTLLPLLPGQLCLSMLWLN